MSPLVLGDAEPLVTIAIPTYNRAATFLPRALAAARAQTYQSLDILVSDNASSDSTTALVESLSDGRIRYHRHEQNVGPARNLDFCIEHSRGIYTLLLMDDDLIDEDLIEVCVSAARNQPAAGIIRTGTRVLNGDGSTLYEAPNRVAGLDFTDFILAWTSGKTAPFLCSTLFRTTALKEVGLRSRHQLWDDVIAELTIAARYGRVDIDEIKASYYVHDAELTVGAAIEDWCDDSLQLMDIVCELAPKDAVLLRRELRPFLGMFNYRNALRFRKSWPRRVAACATVNRVFGPPLDKPELVKEMLRQTRWFNRLRAVRRGVRQQLGW